MSLSLLSDLVFQRFIAALIWYFSFRRIHVDAGGPPWRSGWGASSYNP